MLSEPASLRTSRATIRLQVEAAIRVAMAATVIHLVDNCNTKAVALVVQAFTQTP